MRWRSYLSAIFFILALRSIDLLITYIYTPDLKYEWNPIISFWGATWGTYIVTQFLIVAFIAFLMYFYYKREPLRISDNDLSYREFMYVYFFGRLRPKKEMMLWIFEKPTQLRRHLVLCGFLAMMATIFITVFAIINNMLLMAEVEEYIEFVAAYYNIYYPIAFLIVTIISMYIFFGIEYSKYRNQQKAGDDYI